MAQALGLYGYLPALIDVCKEGVVLPERSRTHFCERPELKRFSSNVQWRKNETKVLDSASGVILALQPITQSEWISECLARPNIEFLLLEKPLAPSPKAALNLLEELVHSGKVFRIGYTFRYTDWGKQLRNTLNANKKEGLLTIRWCFMAHHFLHDLHNWKRFNEVGGGAIRFYGIHLIALLAEIGYRNVTLSRAFGTSPEEVEKWVANFDGSDLPECEIVIDTKSSVSEFKVKYDSNSFAGSVTNVFANLSDPFKSQNKDRELAQIDHRVTVLSQLCGSLWEEYANEYEWYDATLKLWLSIEEKTQFEQI